MKAKVNDKIRIVNKMNDWSMDYKEGDIFTVESTWYGGVNALWWKQGAGYNVCINDEGFWTGITNGYRIAGFHCRNCKKIIIDIGNNTSK